MPSVRQALTATLAVGLLAAPVMATDDTITPALLPGVELVTEEVEPGVHRVLGDGLRRTLAKVGGVEAAPAGPLWAWADGSLFRIGHEDTVATDGERPPFALTAEGDLLVASGGTVLRLDVTAQSNGPGGVLPARPVSPDPPGLDGATWATAIDVASDGSVWASWSHGNVMTAGETRLLRFHDGTWTDHSGADALGGLIDLTTDDNYICDIARGTDDDVWVGVCGAGGRGFGPGGLFRYSDDGWERVPVFADAGRPGAVVSDVEEIATGGDDTTWALVFPGPTLARHRGGSWSVHRWDEVSRQGGFPWSMPTADVMDVDERGVVWALSGDSLGRAVELLSFDGETVREYAAITSIVDLSVDEQGRVWLAGDGQLTVIDPTIAEPTRDLLPGVDLVTEEVEPGVFRVLNDGVRDLEWDIMEGAAPAVISTDGEVWLALDSSARLLGGEQELAVDWVTDEPGEVERTGSTSVRLVPGERGEVTWTRRDGRTLYRYSTAGREVFTAADDTPVFTGMAYLKQWTVVAPDGAGWFSRFDDTGRNPEAPSDCGGLVRYDGERSTYFLQDRGFCVLGLDVDARGNVWVLGWSHFLEDLDESRWNEGPVGIYVITPEALGAEGLGETEPTPSDESHVPEALLVRPGPGPGVDLVTEEVEAGVNRVIGVVRDGGFEEDLPPVDQVATAADGTVWVVSGRHFGRLGDHDLLDGPEMPRGADWQLTVGGDGSPVTYQLGIGGGIARFADGEWQPYPTDGSKAPLYATTTTTGDLWASTNSDGNAFAVGRFDGDDCTWYDLAELGARAGWVFDFAETPDGSIWAGVGNWPGRPADGGLSRFDGREWHPVDPFSTDGRFATHALEVAPDGTLWAEMLRIDDGDEDSYLGRWDGTEWTVRPHDGTWGLPTDGPSDDEEGWPAALVHPEDLGLGGAPTVIERTPDGSVWWTSEGGLYVATPEVLAAAIGPIEDAAPAAPTADREESRPSRGGLSRLVVGRSLGPAEIAMPLGQGRRR